jgi:hypothetical protein
VFAKSACCALRKVTGRHVMFVEVGVDLESDGVHGQSAHGEEDIFIHLLLLRKQ